VKLPNLFLSLAVYAFFAHGTVASIPDGGNGW
jgi:hypothetical protein